GRRAQARRPPPAAAGPRRHLRRGVQDHPLQPARDGGVGRAGRGRVDGHPGAHHRGVQRGGRPLPRRVRVGRADHGGDRRASRRWRLARPRHGPAVDRADPGHRHDRPRLRSRGDRHAARPGRGVAGDPRPSLAADRTHGPARPDAHRPDRRVRRLVGAGRALRRPDVAGGALRPRERPGVPGLPRVVLDQALLPARAGPDARGRRRGRRDPPRPCADTAPVLAHLRHRAADRGGGAGGRQHALPARLLPRPGRHAGGGAAGVGALPAGAQPGPRLRGGGGVRVAVHRDGHVVAVPRPADAQGGVRRRADDPGRDPGPV
ncbi:MAG: Integral membrane protein, partial [uncultured Nocardioides sp.]